MVEAPESGKASRPSSTTWLRVAALALVVAGLGLPVNDLFRYALLLLAAVPIFVGQIATRPKLWLAALGIVALATAAQFLWPAPRFDEGDNLFVVDGNASTPGLPADAFRQMSAEFDVSYPPERRCEPHAFGCWRGAPPPTQPYAFSADAIYGGATASRRVTGIDFADPIWQRLGFINEKQYNWTGTSDIQRGKRNPWWMVLHPWRLSLPYFVMVRFPAQFVGSQLCWRGLVLWEEANERFAPSRHAEFACRPIERGDIGRRIFGVSIDAPLAMRLEPPLAVQLHKLIETGLPLLAAGAVLLLLVRWRSKQLALPFAFMGLSLLVVFLHDASFIGGVRPFDGGDDGLVYEGMARQMVQHLLNGDFAQAIEGTEKVFYYGGPGLRYFRTVEHFIFGDTFLGYLSLTLLLPFIVFAAFRRFLDARSALALALIFIVIPLGAVFGTTFFQYVKWAARGFADPAAATMFLAGLVVLAGPTAAGPDRRFAPAFGAGLLFALALWLRPNLAPGAGILLGGAGLAALWRGEIRRVVGLCIGFLPVLGMALHNWIFGGVFVLFSANIAEPANFPTPPSVYAAALSDLAHLDFGASAIARVLSQIAGLLAGPSESLAMAPLGAVAIVILLRVALCGRAHDLWLRLTAGAALALLCVALFYPTAGRYHYVAWLLTLLVCAAWMREAGLALLTRWLPGPSAWLANHPGSRAAARVLDRWTVLAGIEPVTK